MTEIEPARRTDSTREMLRQRYHETAKLVREQSNPQGR
jgi:hypothetical protein